MRIYFRQFVYGFKKCYSRRMLQPKPKIIAIVGPTASGKTALSIELAKQFNGEIISADSRQVYRGLDIGTAKITEEEKAGIPHHLIDVADVDTIFTAHDFKQLATAAIDDIVERAKVPIIVGGTFFYLDQLRGTSTMAEVPPNPPLRAELEKLSLEELQTKLAEYDRTLLESIDIANPRRLVRALEILDALGHIPDNKQTDNPYDWLVISLQVEKEILHERYTTRAKTWLEAGFLAEISGLIKLGVSRARLTEIGFEYTLGLKLIDKEITESEFILQFVQKNWQYAKRQNTWLKRDQTILSLKPDNQTEIISTVKDFLLD